MRYSSYLIVLALGLGSGVAYEARQPETPAQISARTLSVGHIYDSAWGPVYLEQRGNEVIGTYECCGGGQITGVIRGKAVHYEWSQEGLAGKGRWRIVEGGDLLLGTWGSGDSEWSGGDWNLYRRTTEGS